jgi:large repetitive protein
VLLGDGAGRFGSATSFAAGSAQSSVAVGDFDGDTDPDLAVANSSSDNVSVLLGGAGGSFGTATSFAAGSGPSSVAVGDFDGDSDPDLAVANSSSDNVSVLLGDGAGGFGPATSFAAGGFPASVAVGDFDGDTDPDLAVANAVSGDVSVLLGGAGGSFRPATSFPAGIAPFSVAVGDFDRDDCPDLATANFLSNDVSVLLNDTNRAPVAVDDAYATDEGVALSVPAPGVLANDSDPDGDNLSAALVSGPANGSLALTSDGSFTYTPAAGFAGGDSFSYRAGDPAGAQSGVATVTITVTAAADQIVFASSRTGNGDIYTLDPDGGTLTQLTSGNAVDAEPAWSPNAKRSRSPAPATATSSCTRWTQTAPT